MLFNNASVSTCYSLILPVQFGIRVLVLIYESPATEADCAGGRRTFDANVFGVFDMVNGFCPSAYSFLDGSRAPTIINTASILGRLPVPFAAGYNATEAAVTTYSDSLRIELAPLGIKVLTLFMGEVSTGLMTADNISLGQDSL